MSNLTAINELKEYDLRQIKEHGVTLEAVENQIENFINGFPYMKIISAANIGYGIIRLSEDQAAQYIEQYQNAIIRKKVVKFTPASGAASRMFKSLFAFAETYDGSEEAYNQLKKEQGDRPISSFLRRLDCFAFYNDLKQHFTQRGEILEELYFKKEYVKIVRALLEKPGLGYGKLPKGLLKFHKYETDERTPIEEHLVEAAKYGKGGNNQAHLHFTVSPEHEGYFLDLLKRKMPFYEKRYGVQFKISFSRQKKSTDTVAVDLHNKPFRDKEYQLLFRQGGHGALLENLNDIDADIIFIKNIDNVVPDKIKEATFTFKQALAGLLLSCQSRVFDYLKQLESGVTEAKLDEIGWFLDKKLCCEPDSKFSELSTAQKKEYLKAKLNRPIRVCGMVKNEGEPGGGPFWAKNSDGSVSLQIVESAQIDQKNSDQQAITQQATHFNPVDLVCGVKDYQGNPFNLLKYRDIQTGFISRKSKDGKELKALELPGLWNGAMSDWNTLFVEVPIITFNPVKTVNDLLRYQHQ